MNNPLQKRVDIDVSLARPRTDKSELPRLCMVGVVPYDAPIISEMSPGSSVRRSHYVYGQPYVEQVRLSSVAQSRLLPGIDMQHPSKLRDALVAMLGSGVAEVDCILARVPGVYPWELTNQTVVELLDSFFNEIPGAMIVFPDAGGPWPRSWQQHHDNYEQQQNLLAAVKQYGPLFAEHFQLGFFDMINLPNQEAQQVFNSLLGHDVSLCCWSGNADTLEQHGWRSCAAIVAGYIAKRLDVVTQSLVGHNVTLTTGRRIVKNRAHLLGGLEPLELDSQYEDNCVVLSIDKFGKSAQILSEYTMRRPRYEWSIPVMRTVKAIHQSLRQAADIFVFRPVKKVEAVALEKTVEMVLDPFYDMGILVGPDGTGKPTVSGQALPDYDQPMLSVDLSAMVRPWCQNISLKVMVKSGMDPVIEGGN